MIQNKIFVNKLLKIFGINQKQIIFSKNQVGLNKRISNFIDLTTHTVGKKITRFFENEEKFGKQFKNNTLKIISFEKNIKTYKGLRNKYGYPCRGQRTHTNGKTKKKQKKNF
jgi:small subunit ribosomal protein S13